MAFLHFRFQLVKKDMFTVGPSMPILRSQMVHKSNVSMKEWKWCSRSLLVQCPTNKDPLYAVMTCLKKSLKWVIYPSNCFSTLGVIVSSKLYVKHLPFALWIKKSLTNSAIPCTMIYHVLSECIEYPAAILESGNCSLNLSKSLSVDWNDWLLSTTSKA